MNGYCKRYVYLAGLEGLAGSICALYSPVFVVPFCAVALLALYLAILAQYKWGIYLLLFLVPVAADHAGFHCHTSWSVDVTDIFPVFPIISLVVLMSWLLYRVANFQNEGPEDSFRKILFVFFCWAFLSLFWAPGVSKHHFFQFTLLSINFLLFYLLSDAVNEEKFYRRLMGCWVVFGTIVAVLTLLSAVFIAKNIYSIRVLDYITFKLTILAPPLRAESIASCNETAFVLNLVICIAIGMMLSAQNRFKAVAFAGAIALMMLANFLTLSRAGAGALIIMIYFLLFFIRQLRKRFVRNFVIVNVIIIALLLIQMNILQEKRATPRLMAHKAAAKSQSRPSLLWNPGLKMMEERGSNLGGLGIGGFKRYIKAPHAHSIFFSVLFDFGVVGVMIMLVFIFLLLKKMIVMWRQQDTYLQKMAMCCYGGMVAIGVHGLVDFEYNTPSVWLFLGITVATLKLVQGESSCEYKKVSCAISCV